MNRIVRWTDAGIEYEADPRQAEKLIQELGLEGCRQVAIPGVKHSAEQHNADKLIEEEKVSHFRGLAARGNYFSADRPEC